MRILIQILSKIFFSFIILLLSTNGICQESPDLNEYTLDTIFKPSATDSTVMDTFIIAKKRVVVKKEVVVENQIMVDPLFSGSFISISGSVDSYLNYSFVQKNDLYSFTSEALPGYSIGLGYQSELKKKFNLSVGFDYALLRETVRYNESLYTPISENITVTDTIEIYYISTPDELIPIYVTEDRLSTVYDTIITLNSSVNENYYHSFEFSLGIGKRFAYRKFLIIPNVTATYRNTFSASGKYIDESDNYVDLQDKIYTPHTFKIGINCQVLFPVFSDFFICFSPEYQIFLKNITSYNDHKISSISLSFGFFYKIN